MPVPGTSAISVLSVSRSICHSVYLSPCLSVSMSLCLICLSVYLSLCHSVSMSPCLYVSLSLSFSILYVVFNFLPDAGIHTLIDDLQLFLLDHLQS